LPKKKLEIQLLDLYNDFPAVKEIFTILLFNPKEEKADSGSKSLDKSIEFFPIRRKKPRGQDVSLAQKLHCILLVSGGNPFLCRF